MQNSVCVHMYIFAGKGNITVISFADETMIPPPSKLKTLLHMENG